MTATVAPAPERPAERPTTIPPAGPALLRRPVVMCLVLLLAYFGFALAKDPRASLVSDSGGKLATLRAMDARGDLDPDLGYWAEAFDPQGLAHPMPLTSRIGDKWVNVTTLPMIYAAVPLYELGGFRAILLMPMLAGVMTALGARALARRLGDESDRAFWLVGLATPVTIYALDFWEHAPGLACMVWGVVLLFDVANGHRGWPAALAGGALFGAAATMRTEALVYAAVTFGVVGIAAWSRRRSFPIAAVCAALGGLGAVTLANQMLERRVLGSGLRAGRAAGTAGQLGQDLGVRAKDAVITSIGMNRFAPPGDWIVGAVIVSALAGATALLLRNRLEMRRTAYVLVGVAGYGYAVCLGVGLGFVPGALSASPLAAVGLAAWWRRPDLRRVGLVAVVALPLVWMVQYSNGTLPIWGGRYLLLSSTLLAVVGIVSLRELPRRAAMVLLVLALVVTGSGLAWTSVRTSAVASAWADLARVRGPLVMVGKVQVMREAGAFYDASQPWMAARNRRALAVAVEAADESGADRLTTVSIDPGATGRRLGPYRRGGTDTVHLLPGVDLTVVRYDRVGAG